MQKIPLAINSLHRERYLEFQKYCKVAILYLHEFLAARSRWCEKKTGITKYRRKVGFFDGLCENYPL